MADLRACFCPLCSRGVAGGFSLASRATWYEHRRLRSRRPPLRRRQAATAAPPAAAAPAATAPADSQGDVGAGGEGGGSGGDATGGGETDGDTPVSVPQPYMQRPNGVCVPTQVFRDNIDDFVAYNFFVQHCLSREATEDYLRQWRLPGTCRTPHAFNSMIASSVDLYKKLVDCCRAGCVAFTAHRKEFTACDVCNAPRYRADGNPQKQATYWPLLPWLRMMLADPEIGVGMVSAMKEAREAAESSPARGLRDWFDGATFRKLVALGYFSSNTFIALSISTDGFQAWRQGGFEGWPILATVLSVDPTSRVHVVSQMILGITPGPGQPADLESYLHPIAEQLNALAAGVSGMSVAGFPEPQVVHA